MVQAICRSKKEDIERQVNISLEAFGLRPVSSIARSKQKRLDAARDAVWARLGRG